MWQQGILGEACVVGGAAGYETGIGWREHCNLGAAMAAHRKSLLSDDHPGARPVYVDALKRSLPRRSLVGLRDRRQLWRRILCTDAECCPPAGEGLLADARQHTITRRARSLASLADIRETQWRWSQLAQQAARSLTLADRINSAAAGDGRMAKIDTTFMHAIHVVADRRRTQGRLRMPA